MESTNCSGRFVEGPQKTEPSIVLLLLLTSSEDLRDSGLLSPLLAAPVPWNRVLLTLRSLLKLLVTETT